MNTNLRVCAGAACMLAFLITGCGGGIYVGGYHDVDDDAGYIYSIPMYTSATSGMFVTSYPGYASTYRYYYPYSTDYYVHTPYYVGTPYSVGYVNSWGGTFD